MAYLDAKSVARRQALLDNYSAPRNRSTGVSYNPLSGIADILRGHYGKKGRENYRSRRQKIKH